MSAEKSGPLPSKAAPQKTNSGNDSTAPSRMNASASLDVDQVRALDVARRFIRAGIPVFTAAPNSSRPGEYHLPNHWQETRPDESVLDRWRPGWALAAVGGHVADFLDVDPRNGGDASLADVEAAGQMPRSFGRQETPSGGVHYLISATGERKSTGFMPGLDLQSGDAHGVGRGCIFIAPTVRRSKVTGELVPYRWAEEPDTDTLLEYGPGSDHSTEGIVARVRAKRSAVERVTVSPDDPFLTTSRASAGDRLFTQAEAEAWCGPRLLAVRQAAVGGIEETANVAAATLSHFVPSFWTPDQAMALLRDALSYTAYDPSHAASTWTVEKFWPVLDGRRPPLDNWKAARRTEGLHHKDDYGVTTSTVDRVAALRAKLLSRDDLGLIPPATPLVEGLLDRETESWLIGAAGSFKSFVALDIACHVVTGQHWRGRKVHRGPVLYLAAEGAKGIRKRVLAWEKTYAIRADDLYVLPIPVQVLGSRKGSVSEEWLALVELAAELGVVMVVVDTQARVTVGLEENSATDMGVLTEAVRRLKEASSACVLVVHHTGRNGGDARGSSALDGAQDTELKVVRAEPRSSLQCKLLMDKQKDMAEAVGKEGIPLTLVSVSLGAEDSLAIEPFDPFITAQGIGQGAHQDWDANLTGNQQDVMAALLKVGNTERGATQTEVRQAVDEMRKASDRPAIQKTSFYYARDALVGMGHLVVNGSRFYLPEHAGGTD